MLNAVKIALDNTRFDAYVDLFNKSFDAFQHSPEELARRKIENEKRKAREKIERRNAKLKRYRLAYVARKKQKIDSGELVLDPAKVARARELNNLAKRRRLAKKREQRPLKPIPSAEELQNNAIKKRERVARN